MSGNRVDTRTDCTVEEKYECGCLLRTGLTKFQNTQTKIYCEKHCRGQPMIEFRSRAISEALLTNKISVPHLIDILEHPEFKAFIEPFSAKVAKERSDAEDEKMTKKRAACLAMCDNMFSTKKSKTDE